jgi:hypothetical protein
MRRPSFLGSRAVALALLWLFAPATAAAAPLDDAYLAVVQLPSHGASATVIHTAPGETLVLTVAHAFEGQARGRPVVVLVPRPEGAGTEKTAGIRLAALDPQAALVVVAAGPLPHAARVAPRGFAGSGWAYSCGYDGMRQPATRVLTRVRGTQGPTTFTEQTPWHGRSGGALFDAETGYLVGVVQGYTVERHPVGLYASLASVHAFLDRHGYGRAPGGSAKGNPPLPAGPGASGRGDVPAPARPCPE